MIDAHVKLSEEEVLDLAQRAKFFVDPVTYMVAMSRRGRLTIAAVYAAKLDDPVGVGKAHRNPRDKENTVHAERLALRRAFSMAREDMEVFG